MGTIEATLQQAISHHRSDDFSRAGDLYLEVLNQSPEQPDALHFLGVLRHQQGRDDEAIGLIERSLAKAPSYVDAWNNLGNVYRSTNRIDEAGSAYRQALALNDRHPGAWNNLAMILCLERSYKAALEAHERVIELAPELADAYYNYANTLRAYGDPDEAMSAYRKTIALNPTHSQGNVRIGYLLQRLGRRKEAEGILRDWVSVDPDNATARHMLAACTGEAVPDRASDAYIRETFDDFADSFDRILLEKLGYRAPDLIGGALAEVLGPPQADLEILDAGCGTGLCAQQLRSHARTLVGVDLSPGMLRKAVLRGGYDHLYQAELAQFLEDSPGAFDVIASADTLVYFGPLESVLAGAHGALRPGGWLAFTVERSRDGDVVLGSHGRYGHGEEYLQSTLAAAGFAEVNLAPAIPRTEGGEEVEGFVVRARRRPTSGDGDRQDPDDVVVAREPRPTPAANSR